MGEWLTIWTIRASLVCFAATLCGWCYYRTSPMLLGSKVLLGSKEESSLTSKIFLVLWTIGFLLMVLHILCAFHFVHHWSHRAALEDTAKQTREMMGWEFGEGIYFSYLFVIAWGAHVAGSWIASTRMNSIPMVVHGVWLGYLIFIAFNGAAIFEGGWTRLGTILAFVIAIACFALGKGPSRYPHDN